MRDDKATLDQRLQAARFAAPFLHPRPPPPSEGAAFELPASDTLEGIADAAGAILRAVADGRISALDGRHLADLLEYQRRSLRRVELDRVFKALKPPGGVMEEKPDDLM